MALNWTHFKKTRRVSRESNTRFESSESTKMWEKREDMEKICKIGNRRKRKDLERGEEVRKRQNKMEKLHISPVLRKEQQEMVMINYFKLRNKCYNTFICLGHKNKR
jgi:hypothetical protein